MMKDTVRALLNEHLDIAKTTLSDDAAEVHLNVAMGFLEYASANGDITTSQFIRESQSLKTIRESRRAASARAVNHA